MNPETATASTPVLLKRFLRSLKTEHAAPRTFLAYARDVRSFGEYLLQTGHVSGLDTVTTAQVSEYLRHLARRHSSPATLKRTLMSLRKFYSFLVSDEVTRHDPTSSLTVMDDSSDTLSLEAIDRILQYYQARIERQDPDSRRSERDRTIFLLMLLSGLRQYQVPSVQIGMISTQGDRVKIQIPTGIELLLPGVLVPVLRSYLAQRDFKSFRLVVEEPSHQQITQSTLRSIMTELTLAAGQKINPWNIFNTCEQIQRNEHFRQTVYGHVEVSTSASTRNSNTHGQDTKREGNQS